MRSDSLTSLFGVFSPSKGQQCHYYIIIIIIIISIISIIIIISSIIIIIIIIIPAYIFCGRQTAETSHTL
jgi:hypothetical protein